MKAKKQFGQNFLIDENVLNGIANAVNATENDLIIEIGPGRGALTCKLLDKGCKVVAYEIDTDMKFYLSSLSNNLCVKYQDILTSNINEDISKYDYENLYIVGNLPYYITTPIIDYITKLNLTFVTFTIMVQKEVADRFLAMENSKKYGYYTVFLNNYYDTCKIIDANKFCFDPAPKVDSTVVQLIKKEKPLINDVEFFNFLKKCFSEKRKTLKNNLKELFSNELLTIYHKYNYQDNIRSEGASIEFFIDVYLYLLNNNQI